MATISNVILNVQKGGEGSRRLVTVTYKLCFTSCEALAGSTFIENVQLRGSDDWPNPDDNLVTLSSRCVKATDKCQDRKIAVHVSRSTLDEDGDTIIIIFGQVIFRDANRDELYARITLTPFTPSGSTADSNIVTGQWGAAGNN